MVLLWGFRDWPPPSGTPAEIAEKQRRARILLQDLTDKKALIVVPTVVVAELLTPVPVARHGAFISRLQERFFVKGLDVKNSSVAADLWTRHRTLPVAVRSERSILKADTLIIATARVGGATSFYSHDRKFRALVELAGMEPHDLPTHSEDLFTEAELRSKPES